MRPARLTVLGLTTAAALALGGCLAPLPSPYMQRQQSELERRLAGTSVEVVRRGDDVILRMPNDVTFAFDKSDIQPAFFPVLDTMAEVIAREPGGPVEVSGHADAIGSDAYNQALSERRAAAVADYLAARGVRRERISAEGFGENAPIASNLTEEGRSRNRRVEVRVGPAPANPPIAEEQPTATGVP